MRSSKVLRILALLFLSAGISYANTSNQIEVKNLLKNIYDNNSSSRFSTEVIAPLFSASTPAASLDSLSGEFIANSIKSAALTNDFESLYTRIVSNKSRIPFSLWAQYTIARHYLLKDGDGSSEFTADNSAGSLGFTFIGTESTIIGVYGNYAINDLKQNSDSAKMSGFGGGLYSGFLGESMDFILNIDAGIQNFDTTRNISISSRDWTSQASFQTWRIRGGAELDLKIPISAQGAIRPFIGAQVSHVKSPTIVEKGDTITNLTIDEASYTRLLALIGVKIGSEGADFNWGLKLYAGYLSPINASGYGVHFSQSGNKSVINIYALEESQLSAGAALNLELPLGENFSIILNGSADIDTKSQNFIDYRINSGLNFKFGTKTEIENAEKSSNAQAEDFVEDSTIFDNEKILLTAPIEEQLRTEEDRLGILRRTEKTTEEQMEENRKKLIEELKKRITEARARRQKPLIRTFNMDLAQFETGSFVLTESAVAFIKQLAGWINEYEFNLVTIEGHTDTVGDLQSNILLSSMRAKAVRDELYKNGIPLEKIYYIGYGPTMPIANNKTYNGKLKNRRVEIFVE
ncbi:MAG: autotransporter domain-containing protein [Elusimicrobiota bacterium]|jgi:outer membrane protein OmpA-like peptidoglycan-associated protein|nr:autotransporter domain-containing protein [Elusimicrobiota bacterium]